MQENRLGNRFECRYPVYYHSSVGAGLGTVTEVSFSGLRLELAKPLEPGQSVALLAVGDVGKGQKGLTGTVCWCRPVEVGIRLLDPPAKLSCSFLGDALSRLEGRPSRLFQQRATVRTRLDLSVEAGPGFEQRAVATLEDLSLGGARLACPMPLQKGGRLMVWTTHQERTVVLSARVVNQGDDGRTGICFEHLSDEHRAVISALTTRPT